MNAKGIQKRTPPDRCGWVNAAAISSSLVFHPSEFSGSIRVGRVKDAIDNEIPTTRGKAITNRFNASTSIIDNEQRLEER